MPPRAPDDPGAEPAHAASPRGRIRPAPHEWALLLLGCALTLHYAWLMDDAYVYFRYVDNWVLLGHGLVYNRGEYVEGFSSPLWALLMGALRLTGLSYWFWIRVIGVGSFALFGWLLIRIHRRMAPADVPPVNLPLALLALAYGPLCYFTSGIESPFVQLAAPLFALYLLEPRSRALQVAIAFTPLVRHDLALPLLLCLAFAWWRERRVPWLPGLLAAALGGGWVAFRIVYYADLFPNTFYLKDLADVGQGFVYLRDTVNTYWLHAWAALHVALAAHVFSQRRAGSSLRGTERAMMLVVAFAITVYIVRIGGDPRHYRYLAFPVALALCSTSGLLETLVARAAVPRQVWIARGLAAAAAVAGFLSVPPQLLEHPIWLNDQTRMVDKIRDAADHRRVKAFSPSPYARGEGTELRDDYRLDRRDPRHDHRLVTSHSGCFVIYQRFDRRAVHVLGLTEPFLARTRMKPDRPAHKHGLIPLAEDLVRILRAQPDRRPARGMYGAAVEAGIAPDWIRDNLASFELIERKVYNTHDWRENLELAFTRVPQILPTGAKPVPDDAARRADPLGDPATDPFREAPIAPR